MIRCVEVSLTIPDNEARTALATLRRLGLTATGLERADLYRCEIADDAADALVEALRGIETIFNPSKHAIRSRDTLGPAAGEVWIDEISTAGPAPVRDLRIAGRTIAGLIAFERFTAWRLSSVPGVLADEATVVAATELLLCNPAFQKATRA